MPTEADTHRDTFAVRRSGHTTWAVLPAALLFPLLITADLTPGKRPPTALAPRGRSTTALAQDAMRLIQANCLSCHDSEKQKGGLQLTSRKSVLKGGDSGPAAVPGKPDQSAMLRALAAEADPHMPPKKQLSTNQIALVRRWIQNGLPWDAVALTNREPAIRPVTLGDWPAGFHPSFAVAFSPDGKRLATSVAGRIFVYDTGTTNFTVLHQVTAHRDAVRCMAWSDDGQSLASGSFRELTVWDPESMTIRWSTTNGLAGRILAVRFVPGAGRLMVSDAAPSQPGWIRTFDAASGHPQAAWMAHADSVEALAISRDGKRLATAGADRLVKIWNLEEGRELTVLEGHTAAVLGVAFNSDATQLVSGGADKQLKVWDIQSKETTGILGNHKHGLNGVAWSPDDKMIVAIDDSGEVQSYTELKRHTGEQSSDSSKQRRIGNAQETLYGLDVTADAKRVAAAGHTGCVFVWDESGKLLGKLEPAGAQ